MFRPGGMLKQSAIQIYLLCDCSASMTGKHIAHINLTLTETLKLLSKAVHSNKHSLPHQIKLQFAAINFADNAMWHMMPRIVDEDTQWLPLFNTGGITQLGAAYDLLNQWLNQASADNDDTIIVALITDGLPTDHAEAAFKSLQNQHYTHDMRHLVFALGNDYDVNRLKPFASEAQLHLIPDAKDLLTTFKNNLAEKSLNKYIKK